MIRFFLYMPHPAGGARRVKSARITGMPWLLNIPYKGFKLWYYYSSKHGVHYDRPLMTPSQVLSLNPEPGLIIYQ